MSRTCLFLFAASAVACVPRLETSGGTDGSWDWVAPENSWPSQAPPDGTSAEGWSEGDTAPDFLLMDQYGDLVSLWQFYGKVIVLDVSTMWCAPCQDIATGTEELAQAHPDDLVYVTILHQNLDALPPVLDDLTFWGSTFGITAPILADGGNEDEDPQTASAVLNGSYPALLVLDRDLKVHVRVGSPDHALLEAAVEEALGE